MKFIDIHTHSHYRRQDVIVVQNLFPGQEDQLGNGNYFSIGLHPWNVKRESMNTSVDWIVAQAENPDVIAIGEIGLDKSIECAWDLQTEAFEKQLSIAEKAGKPVVLHCVRAYSEMMAYRKHTGNRIPWIFHWFNANLNTAEQLIDKNCYLSFGHMLFKENSRAFKVFRLIPLNAVFFETDDTGYSIYEIYKQAAYLRNINMHELQTRIHENFNKCFGK